MKLTAIFSMDNHAFHGEHISHEMSAVLSHAANTVNHIHSSALFRQRPHP